MPSTSSSVVRAAAVAAARELTTVAVMYHATVGERLGLGPTDEKALDLLRQHGSLSAGRLAALTGLAPASVTALVDRLVARGFARRSPSPEDGRRVVVEPTAEGDEILHSTFAHLVASIDDLFGGYTDGALALVTEVLHAMAERQRAATAHLSSPTPATRATRARR